MKSRGPKPPFGSVRRSPNRTGGDDFNEPDTPHLASGEFITKYPGTCGGCGRSLSVGERARFNDADELIGVRCCGGDPEEPVADELVIEDIRSVMPRVRRPACPRCFQIPANSGVCGCD